ncbi:MAG TPA: sugar ABC transporter permease [Thermotogota bacterium]|nr:sugar ABC transporter permease [Thermotogota bacterium]
MKKRMFWIITLIASICVFSGFWALYSVVAEQYAQNAITNEKFLVRNANLHFDLLAASRNQLLAEMEPEPASFLQDARAAAGDTFRYALFVDPDGTVLWAEGQHLPGDFTATIFYETLYYSYGDPMSEIALSDGTIHLQTGQVLDDGSVALLGTTIDGFLSQTMEGFGERWLGFFYGAHDDFTSDAAFARESRAQLSALFLKSMNSQRPESTMLNADGVRSIFTTVPLYDADRWDVKAYLGLLTPYSFWGQGLSQIRAWITVVSLLSALLSLLLLSFFFFPRQAEASLERNTVQKPLLKGFLAFLPAVLLALLFFSVHIPRNLEQTTEDSWSIAAEQVVSHYTENAAWITSDLDENLRQMKKTSGNDITVYRNGQVERSTISDRMLKRLSAEQPLVRTAKYEIGNVEINRVQQKSLSFSVGDRRFLLTRDVTDMNNTVLSLQFYGVGLVVILLLASLMFAFLLANIGNPVKIKKAAIGYAFLAPALIHLVWWAAGPMAFSLFLAFRRWSVVDPAKPFVGLGNFAELLRDGPFWNALKNTALYSLHVPLGMAVSLLLAMAVNKAGKVAILLRVLYYLPVVTAGVATTIVWRWIFNRDFGMLNYFLGFFGISKIAWLDSPQFALGAIMLISIWGALGSQMLIFLAGLQGIPKEFYDAASVDGANKFRGFRYITLPLLKPTSLFVLVTSVIGSFQVFTPIYVLTQGGPLRSTDVVFYHIWEAAWVEMRMGYAAAQSWVLFLLLALLTVLEFRMFGKDSWKAYK